ncbi:MAG: four helix bundle protein [Campylobacterota bacterium]|nr:four helix bundle protein [Campylobacterota bacterium]
MSNEEPKSDLLSVKSFDFSLRIIKLYKYLQSQHKEFILSKQVLRSGTAIGALIREAKYAQSKADFLNKLMIALKEANETKYWLELLHYSDYINEKMYNSIAPEIEFLLKLLISSTKTTKETIRKKQ